MAKKYSLQEIIIKSNEVHNNMYDYSLVNYINSRTNVKIICPIHGVFEQTPGRHLNGSDCYQCSVDNRKYTLEEFVELSNKKHNNKYDYSLVEYKNSNSKVKIICPIHGIFEQIPFSHLKYGCSKCGRIISRTKFIDRFNNNLSNGYQIVPNYNKKACEIFNNIMKENGTFIQHAMNGGELYIKELGYWVDGYDKENNIVYEYDENHHFKKGKLKNRDIKRQLEIEKYLNCKFIRIKK